jgi:hypothetical protein
MRIRMDKLDAILVGEVTKRILVSERRRDASRLRESRFGP